MRSINNLILVTGGHATPALAVINELKSYGINNFLWVGNKSNQSGNKETSPEFKMINTLGIRFIDLKTGKLVRKWTPQTFIYGIKQFLLIFLGLFKSIYIVIKYRPKLVLSFGGYLAVPIVIISKLFGSKIITHEQVVVAGLANRLIARFADKVLISFETSSKFYNPKKTIFTGNPIRKEIFEIRSDNLTVNFNLDLPIIYITGGNQGANEINKRIFEIIEELILVCNVIHQTGNSTVTNDYNIAIQYKDKLPINLRDRYTVRDYILPNEIGEAMNKSNLIISRSGANTITEILALGKLSILVPIPWVSYNEQFKNAKLVENVGLGYILEQDNNLTSDILYKAIILGLEQNKINKGFNNLNLDECIKEGKKIIRLDGAKNVSDVVLKLLNT